ncbi:MAG: hypothetical protein JZU52_09380 [Lamprocystis purpurea]|nr:hypothetical protein [Lamprocystis purpurea]
MRKAADGPEFAHTTADDGLAALVPRGQPGGAEKARGETAGAAQDGAGQEPDEQCSHRITRGLRPPRNGASHRAVNDRTP